MKCTRCGEPIHMKHERPGAYDTVERHYECHNCGMGHLTTEAHAAAVSPSKVRRFMDAIEERRNRWHRNLRTSWLLERPDATIGILAAQLDVKYEAVSRWASLGRRQREQIDKTKKKFDCN